MKKYLTTYAKAVNYFGNSLILCNNIQNVDESIYDNIYYEGDEIDIYQYFLTDCTEEEKNFLVDHFGLIFTYSQLLDVFVLCVDHYGTSWGYVDVYTDLEL